MVPKRFTRAAERAREERLDESARSIVTGRTRSGRQISILRGLRTGETIRDSIGHFLIVTAPDCESHPTSHGKRRIDTSEASVEMVHAGSVDVRHPSYGAYVGGNRLQIAARVGQLSIPHELSRGSHVMWDGERVYPTGTPIPPEMPAAENRPIVIASIPKR